MNFFRSMCSRPARKATATHYDSLGISQNSTQGEVKAAYYKLSMLFHPDKNPGDSEAAGKFRDISEAYEVLGNVRTRKQYDKGLLIRIPRYGTRPTVHPQRDQSRASYSPPPPPFSTPVYDFDEWARSHYGATFRRQMENKRRAEEYRQSRRQVAEEGKAEKTTFMLLLLLGLGMLLFKDEDYDRTTLNRREDGS